MSDTFPVRPDHTALVIVDMQRYFTEPGHPFARLSAARVEGSIGSYFERIESEVMPNLGSLLTVFRRHPVPVFYTQLGSYRADGSDLPGWARRLNAAGRAAFGEAVFPAFDAPSAAIALQVRPQNGDRILQKTTTGAIASTSLESDLRGLDVTSVVVAGVLTPFCVTQTARELADRDFDVAIVADGSASLTEMAHAAALSAFAAIYGWVVSTEVVVKALQLQAE